MTGVSVSGSYEEGVDGEILYSDSARLKVVIKFDTLIRILDQSDPRDIFPRGLIVSFYDDNGQISSILTANRAERIVRKIWWWQRIPCILSVEMEKNY